MNQWATSAGLFQSRAGKREREYEEVRELKILRTAQRWSPQNFAWEQIRGLVRQVFLSSSEAPVHHVVLTAMEPETDVRSVCRMVGVALASEDLGDVAVVGNYPKACRDLDSDEQESAEPCEPEGVRQRATRLHSNMWLVPGISPDACAAGELRRLVGNVRREFDFSILQAPPAGASQLAARLGQLTDGVILVLSESRTRRATALNVKESIEAAHVRILGTVLSERAFPMPEKIYRHL